MLRASSLIWNALLLFMRSSGLTSMFTKCPALSGALLLCYGLASQHPSAGPQRMLRRVLTMQNKTCLSELSRHSFRLHPYMAGSGKGLLPGFAVAVPGQKSHVPACAHVEGERLLIRDQKPQCAPL